MNNETALEQMFSEMSAQSATATVEPVVEQAPVAGRKIRVGIVDDHPIVREGLRKLLELEDDMEVVGEADNGRTALLGWTLQP